MHYYTNTLILLAELIAKHKRDGHVSMLRFTTGWKIFLGTPNLDGVNERERIWEMDIFPTLDEALENFILQDDTFAQLLQAKKHTRIPNSVLNTAGKKTRPDACLA